MTQHNYSKTASLSLSGDNGVLLDGHIGADVAVEPWLIRLGFRCPHTIPEGQGESVVIGEQLRGFTLGALGFHGLKGVVPSVEPGALHVNPLLGVLLLAGLTVQVLSSEAGKCVHLLGIKGSHVAAGLLVVFGLEFFNGFADLGLGRCAMEVLKGGIKVALVMPLIETGNYGAETCLSATDGAATYIRWHIMLTQRGSTQRCCTY